MDWLVRPLAMTFWGGAEGGSSGRDTLRGGGTVSTQGRQPPRDLRPGLTSPCPC